MAIEKTLVIVKPDGVRRGLTGVVIATLERAGLELRHLSYTMATPETIEAHYAPDPVWLETAGGRAVSSLEEAGLDWRAMTGADNAADVGQLIRSRLVSYMTTGPVVVMVVEGPQAVRKVRQLTGSTAPLEAAPGSIRGMYCTDDVVASFQAERALENVIHASGSVDEAQAEIALWT